MTVWLSIAAAAIASTVLYFSLASGMLGALLLAYFASLPLFLLGLGIGAGAAALAAVGSIALLMLVADIAAAAQFGITTGAPTAILVQRALLSRPGAGGNAAGGAADWYPAGRLVVWLAGIPSAVLIIAFIAFLGGEGGLEGQVRRYVGAQLGSLLELNPDLRPEEERLSSVTSFVVGGLPGMASFYWTLVILVNGCLAQMLLARTGRAIRPSVGLTDIELPRWAPFPLVMAGLAALFASEQIAYLGFNLLPLLALPFFLSGLGVVHAAARRTRARVGLLALFYLMLLIAPRLTPLLTVAIGLADHWLALKRRFT